MGNINDPFGAFSNQTSSSGLSSQSLIQQSDALGAFPETSIKEEPIKEVPIYTGVGSKNYIPEDKSKEVSLPTKAVPLKLARPFTANEEKEIRKYPSTYKINNDKEYESLLDLPYSDELQRAIFDYQDKVKAEKQAKSNVKIPNLLFKGTGEDKQQELEQFYNNVKPLETEKENAIKEIRSYDPQEDQDATTKGLFDFKRDKEGVIIASNDAYDNIVKATRLPGVAEQIVVSKIIPGKTFKDLKQIIGEGISNSNSDYLKELNAIADNNPLDYTREKHIGKLLMDVSSLEQTKSKLLDQSGAKDDYFNVLEKFKSYNIPQRELFKSQLQEKIKSGVLSETAGNKEYEKFITGLQKQFISTLPKEKAYNFTRWENHAEKDNQIRNAFLQMQVAFPEIAKREASQDYVNKLELESTGIKSLGVTNATAVMTAWNKIMDWGLDAMNLGKLSVDIIGHPKGFETPNLDTYREKTIDFVDNYLKFTVPNNAFIDDSALGINLKGIVRSLVPTVMDMAALIYGAGKFTKMGELAGLGEKTAGTVGLTASGMAVSYRQYEQTALDKGMSPDQAMWYGLGTSFLIGMAENISPNKSLQQAFTKGVTSKESFDVFKNVVKTESKFKTIYNNGLLAAKEAGLEEPLQEFSQNALESFTNGLANKTLVDKNNRLLYFNEYNQNEQTTFDETFWDYKKLKETYLLTFLSTALLHAGTGVSNTHQSKTSMLFEMMNKYDDNQIANTYDKLNLKGVDQSKIDNVRTEIKELRDQFNTYSKVLTKDQMQTAFPLLVLKRETENKIKALSEWAAKTTEDGGAKNVELEKLKKTLSSIDEMISFSTNRYTKTPVNKPIKNLPTPVNVKDADANSKDDPKTLIDQIYKSKGWDDTVAEVDLEEELLYQKTESASLWKQLVELNSSPNKDFESIATVTAKKLEYDSNIEALKNNIEERKSKTFADAKVADKDPNFVSAGDIPDAELPQNLVSNIYKAWKTNGNSSNLVVKGNSFSERRKANYEARKKMQDQVDPSSPDAMEKLKEISSLAKKENDDLDKEEVEMIPELETEIASIDNAIVEVEKVVTENFDNYIEEHKKQIEVLNGTINELENNKANAEEVEPFKDAIKKLETKIENLEHNKNVVLGDNLDALKRTRDNFEQKVKDLSTVGEILSDNEAEVAEQEQLTKENVPEEVKIIAKKASENKKKSKKLKVEEVKIKKKRVQQTTALENIFNKAKVKYQELSDNIKSKKELWSSIKIPAAFSEKQKQEWAKDSEAKRISEEEITYKNLLETNKSISKHSKGKSLTEKQSIALQNLVTHGILTEKEVNGVMSMEDVNQLIHRGTNILQFLQVDKDVPEETKIAAKEYSDALFKLLGKGTTLEVSQRALELLEKNLSLSQVKEELKKITDKIDGPKKLSKENADILIAIEDALKTKELELTTSEQAKQLEEESNRQTVLVKAKRTEVTKEFKSTEELPVDSKFFNADGTGKLIYSTPTSGKTTAIKKSNKIEDFDNILYNLTKKLVEKFPGKYPLLEQSLTKDTHNIGWDLYKQLVTSSNSTKETKVVYERLKEAALKEAKVLNEKGITIFGGNTMVLENADMFISYGKNTSSAVREEMTKRGRQDNVLSLSKREVKLEGKTGVIILEQNQHLSDIIFTDPTKTDFKKIKERVAKRMKQMNSIDRTQEQKDACEIELI